MNAAIHVTLEEADYVAAQPLCRPPQRWWTVLQIIGAAALLYVAWRSYQAGRLMGVYVSLGALMGGVLGGLVMKYAWIPWQARRIFRQQMSLHRPFELSWDEGGVHARDGNGEYRHSWADFTRWRESERLIVLNLSDAMFLMVPKRAFSDAASREAFRGMLRSRLASR